MTPALKAIELERMKRDPHWFLFTSGYVRTKDEHNAACPVGPLPDLPYLRALLDLLLVSGGLLEPVKAGHALAAGCTLTYLLYLAQARILFIEKSRQMLVSWLLCGYGWWRGKALAHQLILVQSKKEEDAANLVYSGQDKTNARMSFLEAQLPRHLQTIRHQSYGHLYDANGTHWWGIPEGGAIIRSNTPSVLFSDEAAFQPEFGKAYTAALPAVKGGGQLIAVSSAELGDFCDLIEGLAA